MKTSDCIQAATSLRMAKVTKMEDKEKMTVIKAMRALDKVAKEYEELVKEVKEKLKDERFDNMSRRGEEFNASHREGQDLTAGEQQEVKELNAYFADYNKRLDEMLKKEYEREVTVEYERLAEDSFGRLVASNDFTVQEIINIEAVLV